MISSGFFVFSSMSNTSMSANLLNRTPLPSMTGLPASAPISPSPSTAVPFVTTATRLPLAVYLNASPVLLDFQAGNSDSRCVGEAEIALRTARLGRGNFNFPWAAAQVIRKSL